MSGALDTYRTKLHSSGFIMHRQQFLIYEPNKNQYIEFIRLLLLFYDLTGARKRRLPGNKSLCISDEGERQ